VPPLLRFGSAYKHIHPFSTGGALPSAPHSCATLAPWCSGTFFSPVRVKSLSPPDSSPLLGCIEKVRPPRHSVLFPVFFPPARQSFVFPLSSRYLFFGHLFPSYYTILRSALFCAFLYFEGLSRLYHPPNLRYVPPPQNWLLALPFQMPSQYTCLLLA